METEVIAPAVHDSTPQRMAAILPSVLSRVGAFAKGEEVAKGIHGIVLHCASHPSDMWGAWLLQRSWYDCRNPKSTEEVRWTDISTDLLKLDHLGHPSCYPL